MEDEDMNAENSQRGARASEKSGVIQKATRRPKWNVNKNWREKGRKLAAEINTILHIHMKIDIICLMIRRYVRYCVHLKLLKIRKKYVLDPSYLRNRIRILGQDLLL